MSFGVVIATYDTLDRDAVAGIVYGYDEKLYVLPKILFDRDWLIAEGHSKSQVIKRSRLLCVGWLIRFYATEDRQIHKYFIEKDGVLEKGEPHWAVGMLSDECIEYRATGVVSNEKVRRFHSFDTGHKIPIPNAHLLVAVPNVVYQLYYHINLDFHGHRPDRDPAELCRPTYTVSFDKWLRVLKSPSYNDIGSAPWNRVNRPVYYRRRRNEPSHVILGTAPNPGKNGVQCLILNDKEMFCANCPDQKCLIGISLKTKRRPFTPGLLLHDCDLFFSFHNNAYIVCNGYFPAAAAGKEHPMKSLGYEYPTNKFGIENPMRARVTDQGTEFLAFAKLNRFGHTFCNASIPFIADPKNILHGYVKLGDDNIISEEIELEQGRGIPVWIRYLREKANARDPARFEVVALAEEAEYRLFGSEQTITITLKKAFEPFTTDGLMLNKRGTVYCPHVCNFPIFWDNPQVDAGILFKFQAKFNEQTQQYEVLGMLNIIDKFETIKLANEDDSYAFRLLLQTNWQFTPYLFSDFGCMGFVEDVTGDLSKFARALSYYKPDKQFMIWCRENVDLEQRVTPLVCMGIEQPEGILVVKKDG